jgi:hypothetical protein
MTERDIWRSANLVLKREGAKRCSLPQSVPMRFSIEVDTQGRGNNLLFLNAF